VSNHEGTKAQSITKFGFTQGSQGIEGAMFFRQEGARAQSKTKTFLYF
jgi:hypothetical protein